MVSQGLFGGLPRVLLSTVVRLFRTVEGIMGPRMESLIMGSPETLNPKP